MIKKITLTPEGEEESRTCKVCSFGALLMEAHSARAHPTRHSSTANAVVLAAWAGDRGSESPGLDGIWTTGQGWVITEKQRTGHG